MYYDEGDDCIMEETIEHTNNTEGRMPRSAKVPPSRSGKKVLKAGVEEDVYEDDDCIMEVTTQQTNNTEGQMPRNAKVPLSQSGKKVLKAGIEEDD